MNNLAFQLAKIRPKVQWGLLNSLRMTNQAGHRTSSSGHSGQQKEQSDATYGAPEYYQYDEYSFNDIHMDMEKYRLPRPSSKSEKQESK